MVLVTWSSQSNRGRASEGVTRAIVVLPPHLHLYLKPVENHGIYFKQRSDMIQFVF